MAGMDWFRWHHGSVTDPKFRLVASRAKVRVSDVIAVWAALLEEASQAERRGQLGVIDFESLDCLLGFDDGQAQAIHAAMKDRGLLSEDGVITRWEKRQPKRERDDPTSTLRSQESRARKAAMKAGNAEAQLACDGSATQHHATPNEARQDHESPRNATQRQETPRGEESREEEKREGEIARTMPDPARATPAGIACFRMKAVGLADTSPSHPKLLALLAAGITLAELVDAARSAVASKKGFAYALATAEGRRRDAATQPLPESHASHGRASEPAWRAEQRARVQQFAPGVAAKPFVPQPDFIDVEATDAVPNRLA